MVKILIFQDILPNGNYELTVEFLKKITDMMLVYIKQSLNREQKILNFNHPHELKAKVSLGIGNNPLPLSQIVDDCQTAFEYSVRIGYLIRN